MALRVQTRLVAGCPRVELRDEESGELCYCWEEGLPASRVKGHAVQELIRLLLLASAQ